MKILISGGGLAGLAVACFLEEAGHDVEIIEAKNKEVYPEYVVDFFGAGLEVLKRRGMRRKLDSLKKNFDFSSFAIKKLYEENQDKIVSLSIRDLRDLFCHQLKSSIHYETRIHEIETNSCGSKVVLSSGKEETYDLVILAEGVHSHTRKLLFPETKIEDLDLYFSVCTKEKRDESKVIGSTLNPKISASYDYEQLEICYPVTLEDEASFVMSRKPQESKDCHHFYTGKMELVILQKAFKGRVVMLGDTLGSLSPLSGQGSSMAVYQAHVLVGLIEKHKSVKRALQEYEEEVLPHIQRIQKEVRTTKNLLFPKSRLKYLFVTKLGVLLFRLGLFNHRIKKMFAVHYYDFLSRAKK